MRGQGGGRIVILSVEGWLDFLKDSHGAAAFPLIVGGLGLMFFGWRFWRLCVILAFGLIGAIAGGMISEGSDDSMWYSIIGAAVFAAMSLWPVRTAIALLGGSIGGGVGWVYLTALNVDGPMLWGLAATCVVGTTAFAVTNRQMVVILVTGFLGAVAVMSGLTAMIMKSPALYGTLETMAANSMIVIPFALLVPTVMSFFFQSAEVKRLQVEI